MAKHRRPTLRDVGALAGVDVSTVSRILRGDAALSFSDETRARVIAAARELGYQPNMQARGLRLQRQHLIGLVVPDLDNLGFTEIMHGVQDVAAAEDYLLLILEATGAAEAENLYQRLVGGRRVDGLLAAFESTDIPLAAHWVARDQAPIVLLQRGAPGVPAVVVMDEERNARVMVEHLAELGHRRIGHVAGAANTDTGLRRRHGFVQALAGFALPIEERWIVDGRFTYEGGHAATRAIFEDGEPPTALAVANLLSALGTLAALDGLGLRVPEDVSVVAIDDHPFAAQTRPPLTTIRTPQRSMGRAAARMLLDVIDGKPASRIVISEPPKAVVRASSGPPPRS
jgi:LacI family transcriptional regulator